MGQFQIDPHGLSHSLDPDADLVHLIGMNRFASLAISLAPTGRKGLARLAVPSEIALDRTSQGCTIEV
jgi:hypothetical protein